MNSGARGADDVASQRWTNEAVAARFAEHAADLALSRSERDSLAATALANWKPKRGNWRLKRAPRRANSNACARKSSNTRRLFAA